LGGRGRWISEFKANLIYNVSSRTARATQRNPVSKNQKKKKKKKKKKERKKTKESVSSVSCT
jgi:ACT domain-containing protein